jgi:hypothetical protein
VRHRDGTSGRRDRIGRRRHAQMALDGGTDQIAQLALVHRYNLQQLN